MFLKLVLLSEPMIQIVPLLFHLIGSFSLLLEKSVLDVHHQQYVWLFCLIHNIASFLFIMVIQFQEVCFILYCIFLAIRYRILDSILLEFLQVCRLFVLPKILWMAQFFFHSISSVYVFNIQSDFIFYFEIWIMLAVF